MFVCKEKREVFTDETFLYLVSLCIEAVQSSINQFYLPFYWDFFFFLSFYDNKHQHIPTLETKVRTEESLSVQFCNLCMTQWFLHRSDVNANYVLRTVPIGSFFSLSFLKSCEDKKVKRFIYLTLFVNRFLLNSLQEQ